RAPTGDARHGEDRRVQFRRKLQHRENRRGVEIDVGAELFLALHRFFEILADRHPLLLAQALSEIAPDLALAWHAPIALPIDAMADAHELGLLRERLLQPTFVAVLRPDVVVHPPRFFVRPLVYWSLIRPAFRA